MILTGASPLVETVTRLRRGDTDLLAWLGETLARVDALEGEIGALIPEAGRRERLLADAQRLLDRYPEPHLRPALFGIPVAVKDVFAIDGFPTRAGSRLPAAIFKSPQAPCVTSLLDAGALILGKTAMDEFSYCEPPATRNPHAPDHTPGGSSGGSAAAVAAAYTPLALGAQTTRSIIGPAAFCGVVGYKASHGRIPGHGAVPLAPSLDTVGLFTQDVEGALLAASVIVPSWRPSSASAKPRLAVPQGRFMTWVDDGPREQFQAALERLRAAGYGIEEQAWMTDDDLEQVYESALKLLVGEMAEVHKVWFSLYENQYRERTAMAIRKGTALSADDILGARTGQIVFRTLLEQFMESHHIDLWVTPSSRGPAPAGYDVTGWGGMTIPWSYAGLPCVSLPGGGPGPGSSNTLPVGLQCIGRYGRDEDLLHWAKALAEAV